MLDYAAKIHTVTELTKSIRGLLETQFPFVTVCGEVSNLRQPQSGHLYFTLKDAGAQVKAVFFKMQLRYIAFVPKDGLEVICRGRISVYEPRGEYQLVVDFMEVKGAGALQLAFEQLKRRLEEEGLFAASLKKSLPFLPNRVALVTSPTGAAVFDFLRVARQRFPGIPVEIFPVRVQGEGAADDIVEALALLNERQSSEVIVLCRGGGSLEDLWCFNEEKVARAIYACRIPLVSAVGHEIDFTIADFVADFRAPTPSAAAEAVVPEKTVLLDHLAVLGQRLAREMRGRIFWAQDRLAILRRVLGDPRTVFSHHLLRVDYAHDAMVHASLRSIGLKRARLQDLVHQLLQQSPQQRISRRFLRNNELLRRLHAAIKVGLERKRLALAKAAGLLEAVSPLAVLARGYAIVRTIPQGAVVLTGDQVQPGQEVDVRLHRGNLLCEVKGVSEAPET